MIDLQKKILKLQEEKGHLEKGLAEASESVERQRKGMERIRAELQTFLAQGKDSQKLERSYRQAENEAWMAQQKLSGIEARLKNLTEEIEQAESNIRRDRRDACAKEGEATLKELEVIQAEQIFPRVKRVAMAAEGIEQTLTGKLEKFRIDPVKVLVRNSKLRDIYTPRREEVSYSSDRQPFDTRIEKGIPISPGDPIYLHVAYERAVQGEREGLWRIVEEFSPQYDFRLKTEPEPEILRDLKSVEMGNPVSIRGSIHPAFKPLQDQSFSGVFKLDVNTVSRILDKKERDGFLKKLEEEV